MNRVNSEYLLSLPLSNQSHPLQVESKAESETEEGEKVPEGETERNTEKEPESEGAAEPKTGKSCSRVLGTAPKPSWEWSPGTWGCSAEQIPLEPPCRAQAPNPSLSFPALGMWERELQHQSVCESWKWEELPVFQNI